MWNLGNSQPLQAHTGATAQLRADPAPRPRSLDPPSQQIHHFRVPPSRRQRTIPQRITTFLPQRRRIPLHCYVQWGDIQPLGTQAETWFGNWFKIWLRSHLAPVPKNGRRHLGPQSWTVRWVLLLHHQGAPQNRLTRVLLSHWSPFSQTSFLFQHWEPIRLRESTGRAECFQQPGAKVRPRHLHPGQVQSCDQREPGYIDP